MKRCLLFALAILLSADDLVPARAQEVAIPDPGLETAIRVSLQKFSEPLTEEDLLSLTNLTGCCRSIVSLGGLERARHLVAIDLNSNALTNFAFASAWTELKSVNLFNNHLTDFSVPSEFANLTQLDLGFNSLSQLFLPDGMTNLDTLFLEGNLLTHFLPPKGLIGLTKLDLAANALSSFTMPADMTNLVNVLLFANRLTNVTLPNGLHRLNGLLLDFNQLHTLALPAGLTNLVRLSLLGNQLTNLTLLPDMSALTVLFTDGNPLASFVIPETLAATNLVQLAVSLRNQGVAVFEYSVNVALVQPQTLLGAFTFGITGPPGVYAVLTSTNLTAWSEAALATNVLGSIRFSDTSAALSRRFYEVRSLR